MIEVTGTAALTAPSEEPAEAELDVGELVVPELRELLDELLDDELLPPPEERVGVNDLV